MLFISITLAIVIGCIIWKFTIENLDLNDVEIPKSANINYNQQPPIALNVDLINKEFENNQNHVIMLYLYTTWCQVCNKNFEVINEIAREFQNTNFKIIAVAIDRNTDPEAFANNIKNLTNLYFPAYYLADRNGFIDFLKNKKVNYNNRIPFTIIFNSNQKIISKFAGIKSKNYLRNKIIKELFPKN